jgi:tRNA A-37 threonylcarbamoyl transferase component Bud32
MEKVAGMSVSDFYGENFEDVPCDTMDKIRSVVQSLKDHNIIYPDITGYNFIEVNKKIWVIDFEHARFGFSPKQTDTFVDKFLSGLPSWNPRFK